MKVELAEHIENVLRLYKCPDELLPVILSSPHSGRCIPSDFNTLCSPDELRRAEDAFVDELIIGSQPYGANILIADFPRAYIDVNRAEDDIDGTQLAGAWPIKLFPTSKCRVGIGLIRKYLRGGRPLYSAPLSVQAVLQRLNKYYRPYHMVLDAMVAENYKMFGKNLLIDCHSMPSQDNSIWSGRLPDFVIGTLEGKSCAIEFAQKCAEFMVQAGYAVRLDMPYKGVEILKRYGNPSKGKYAFQLEINRDLYLYETTWQKKSSFDELKIFLKSFFQHCAKEFCKNEIELQPNE